MFSFPHWAAALQAALESEKCNESGKGETDTDQMISEVYKRLQGSHLILNIKYKHFKNLIHKSQAHMAQSQTHIKVNHW